MESKTLALIAVILLGFGLVPFLYPSEFSNGLQIHMLKATQSGNMLTQLTLYALIVERVTEVYSNAVFSGDKNRLEVKVMKEERKANRLGAILQKMPPDVAMTAAHSITDELRRVEDEISKIKDDKFAKSLIDLDRRIVLHTTFFAIGIGLLISLVGVRVISSLVQIVSDSAPSLTANDAEKTITGVSTNPKAILEVNEFGLQSKLRGTVDVVLTGLLLAGGAKGLHPIINQVKKLNAKPV